MTTTPLNRLALTGALALVAITSATPRAFAADDADSRRGAQLFTEGKAAIEKNDFATACRKFAESMKVAPRPNVVFSLAQCEEHEKQLVSARRHWGEGQAAIDSQDPRVAIARDRIAALDKRIASLLLHVSPDTPPDAHVKIDGVEIDKKTIAEAIPMDPGVHAVTLQALGREERSISITLAESEKKESTVSPGAPDASYVAAGAAAPKSADLANAPGQQPDIARASSTKRTIGFVVGGVGIAGLVVAGITSGMLAAQNSTIQKDCPNKVCTQAGLDAIDSQRGLFAPNYVAWGVGIAGAGLGAFLILTSKSGGAPATTAVLAPKALPGGAGLGVDGRF